MKKSTNLNIDEVLDNFSGMFFWKWHLDISSIKYSKNVLNVTGFTSVEIEKQKNEIENSWPFKMQKILTYLPKKIKSLLFKNGSFTT